MKGILTVLSFTFRQQLRKRSFIMSSVILILLSVAAICVPAIVNYVQNSSHQTSPSVTSSTVYVIDSTNVVAGSLKEFDTAFQGFNFVLKQPSDKQDILKSIESNNNYSLIVLDLNNGLPAFNLYVQNSGDGPDTSQLSALIKAFNTANLLELNKVPQQVISAVNSDVSFNVDTLGKGTVSGMIAGFAVIFLLFFSIYMFGVWVAMSIASEKTSRVMEILITSTKPSRIVIGKSAGMGLLGLSQLLTVIAIDAVVYFAVYPKNFQIGGTMINLSNFSPFVIFIIIVYFILGFSLYAMMSAVAGSTVSKSEDVQQAIMPVSLIAAFSFYFAYSTILFPENHTSVIASIIPFSAAFAMPPRILSSSVPGWQIAVSIIILAATTALIGYFSIRLYSSAVLHYGKRLKISELIRISKKH